MACGSGPPNALRFSGALSGTASFNRESISSISSMWSVRIVTMSRGVKSNSSSVADISLLAAHNPDLQP